MPTPAGRPVPSGQRAWSMLFPRCHCCHWAQTEGTDQPPANPACVDPACTYMGGKHSLLPAGSRGPSGVSVLPRCFELMAGSLTCGEKHTLSCFRGALSSSGARGEGSPQPAAHTHVGPGVSRGRSFAGDPPQARAAWRQPAAHPSGESSAKDASTHEEGCEQPMAEIFRSHPKGPQEDRGPSEEGGQHPAGWAGPP